MLYADQTYFAFTNPVSHKMWIIKVVKVISPNEHSGIIKVYFLKQIKNINKKKKNCML